MAISREIRIGLILGIMAGLLFSAGYALRLESAAKMNVRTKASDSNEQSTEVASTNPWINEMDFAPVSVLYDTLRSLRSYYVEPITQKEESEMSRSAVKAMLGAMRDPHTRFLSKELKTVITDANNGNFHGIGAVLSIKSEEINTTAKEIFKQSGKNKKPTNEYLIVLSVLPGSPAEKAGIKPGDKIVEVDGKSILSFNPFHKLNELASNIPEGKEEKDQLKKVWEEEQKRLENGITIIEAEEMLASKDNKQFKLKIERDNKNINLTVAAAPVVVNSVSSDMLKNNTGYIRVNYLNLKSAESFGKELKTLSNKGARSLILDLRNSTGADEKSAIEVAGYFMPNKTFAKLEGARKNITELKTPSLAESDIWKKPVIVLVDEYTARMTEVLAQSFKSNGKARVIGTKTFGDFACVSLYNLKDNSAFTLTTGMYLDNNNANYHGKGLPVDMQIASTGDDDIVLRKALELLSKAGS
ncbi:MAG: S41 family peptidase [Armatimonadota bacterium]